MRYEAQEVVITTKYLSIRDRIISDEEDLLRFMLCVKEFYKDTKAMTSEHGDEIRDYFVQIRPLPD